MARSAGPVRARGEAAADGTDCEPRGLAGREGANLCGPKARLNGALGPKSLRRHPMRMITAVSTRRAAIDRSRTARMRAVGRDHLPLLLIPFSAQNLFNSRIILVVINGTLILYFRCTTVFATIQ